MKKKIPRERRTKVRGEEDKQAPVLNRGVNPAESVSERDVEVGEGYTIKSSRNDDVRKSEYICALV